MNKKETRIIVKNTALNKIRVLYHPDTIHNFTYYEGEGSKMEQLSYEVKRIINELEKELDKINKL